MLTVYTAQYRYSGPDRLDITVKGKDQIGWIFAPTWPMVRGIQSGTLLKTEAEAIALQIATKAKERPPSYEAMYYALMAESYNKYLGIWQQVWDMSEVTFVCFCPEGAFCHRYQLKDMFVRMGASYGGERS